MAGVDALNELIGRALGWLVLAAVLVSAGNALLRYGVNLSSNAWLELQWYLFSAVFLLGGGYALRHQAHVRVDVLYGRFSARGQAWVHVLGALLCVLPMAVLLTTLGWIGFVEAWTGNEMSADAGGLLRWPVKALIPVGFGLLTLQALAEAARHWPACWGRTVASDSPAAHDPAVS